MTDITTLIAEARKWTDSHVQASTTTTIALIHELGQALEADLELFNSLIEQRRQALDERDRAVIALESVTDPPVPGIQHREDCPCRCAQRTTDRLGHVAAPETNPDLRPTRALVTDSREALERAIRKERPAVTRDVLAQHFANRRVGGVALIPNEDDYAGADAILARFDVREKGQEQ